MSLEILEKFFLWFAVINFSASLLVFAVVIIGKKMVYKIHSSLFGISEEKAAEAIYSAMINYKTLVWFFSIIPYIVIKIIQ